MRPTLLGILFGVLVGLVVSGQKAESQYGNNPAYGGTAIVPYYASVYNPGGGQSAEDAKKMIALLASIDQRMANLEARLAPVPAATVQKLDPFTVAAAKCASCHSPAAADGKGGGFILFATDEIKAFRPLSTRDKTKIKEAVQNGDMPPAGKGKLEPHEKAAFNW